MTGRSTEPGYQRLAEHLRQQIRQARWADEDPLPTDAELAAGFGVSRQTVRRAYLELVNEGLVYRVPGRGTFVTPSELRFHRPLETVDDLLGLAEDTELEVISPLMGTYDQDAAEGLHLEDRLMYGIRFLRRHLGVVFCHTSVWLPPKVGRLLEDEAVLATEGGRTTSTIIGALSARGVQAVGADQWITAGAATKADVDRLGAREGQPLLLVTRCYYGKDGEPIEWAVSEYLPEHFTHQLRLGRRGAVPRVQPPVPPAAATRDSSGSEHVG